MNVKEKSEDRKKTYQNIHEANVKYYDEERKGHLSKKAKINSLPRQYHGNIGKNKRGCSGGDCSDFNH